MKLFLSIKLPSLFVTLADLLATSFASVSFAVAVSSKLLFIFNNNRCKTTRWKLGKKYRQKARGPKEEGNE